MVESLTERQKLRLAINKNRDRVSHKFMMIFNNSKRDRDQIIIEILSILFINKVMTARFLVEVLGLNHGHTSKHIKSLVDCGAVMLYKRGDKTFRQKLWEAYEFQRKYDMVLLIKYVKAIEEGIETFDTIKFKKLIKFQTERPLSSGELFVFKQHSQFIEITEKGKILLAKYLKLYAFLTADKSQLGLTDNINHLMQEFVRSTNIDLELLIKDSNSLLKIIREKDVMQLLISQKNNPK